MASGEMDELADVLGRVKNWSPSLRIALARRLLRGADAPQSPEAGRGKSLKDLVGLLKTDAAPPTDEECRNVRDEELARKYGIGN